MARLPLPACEDLFPTRTLPDAKPDGINYATIVDDLV
jgi:hypothetical protein